MGVGNSYTATLSSTTAILEAVRAASICRQGICREQQPSLLWAEPLPQADLATRQQAFSLHLSPDSKLCAVDFFYKAATAPDRGMGPWGTTRLAVYETHTGVLKHTLSGGHTQDYVRIRWSPCSAQLIVHRGWGADFKVHDAATGELLADSETLCLQQYLPTTLDISPDGKLMVVCLWEKPEKVELLSLAVLSMEDFSLVANARIVPQEGSPCHDSNDCSTVDWVWHPASKGLIIAGCSWEMADPTPIQAAGLSVGHCQMPAQLSEDTAFSPSGRMLCVPAAATHGPGFHRLTQVAILQCHEEDQSYRLDILRIISSTAHGRPTALWCPLQPAADVLLLEQGNGLRLVLASGGPLGRSSPPHFHGFGQQAFSPCGTLCSVSSVEDSMTMHMLHCKSGAIYRVPESCGNDPSDCPVKLFWPASGSCIVEQTMHCSSSMEGGLRPFRLVQFSAGLL